VNGAAGKTQHAGSIPPTSSTFADRTPRVLDAQPGGDRDRRRDEDDILLVVDKAAGWWTHPAHWRLRRNPRPRAARRTWRCWPRSGYAPGSCTGWTRTPRAVTGPKTDAAIGRRWAGDAARYIEREYRGIVVGSPTDAEGTIRARSAAIRATASNTRSRARKPAVSTTRCANVCAGRERVDVPTGGPVAHAFQSSRAHGALGHAVVNDPISVA